MSNYNPEVMGKLIKKLRSDLKLSLTDFASAIGVSKAAASQWESGKNKGIKTEYLYSIAKYFNITVEELTKGKLNSESDMEFLNRNYNLDYYDIDELIDNKNIDAIKEMLKKCGNIKDQFYKLLPKWANNNLSNNELIEMEYLRKYFKFDFKHYVNKTKDYGSSGSMSETKEKDYGSSGSMSETKEKDFIMKIHNSSEMLDKENYYWEIRKLYDFTYDENLQKIIAIGNLDVLECMLKVIDQVQKDSLLNNYLVNIDDESDIGKDLFCKVMLNNGCNCMLKYKTTSLSIDESELKLLDGHVEILEQQLNNYLDRIILIRNYGGHEELHALKHWKEYSYEQYQKFVDYYKTKLYKGMVNYKEKDPLNYYKLLLELDGKMV